MTDIEKEILRKVKNLMATGVELKVACSLLGYDVNYIRKLMNEEINMPDFLKDIFHL